MRGAAKAIRHSSTGPTNQRLVPSLQERCAVWLPNCLAHCWCNSRWAVHRRLPHVSSAERRNKRTENSPWNSKRAAWAGAARCTLTSCGKPTASSNQWRHTRTHHTRHRSNVEWLWSSSIDTAAERLRPPGRTDTGAAASDVDFLARLPSTHRAVQSAFCVSGDGATRRCAPQRSPRGPAPMGHCAI